MSGAPTCACEAGYTPIGLGCYAPPRGPLAGLPSPDGPHMTQIAQLGDGEWLRLGAPAPDAAFGMGRGRSWGGRAFVLAPELGGAFFTGEGVHAYVKPDGYAMDDIFFYDLRAHRWIAVYPGMHVASFNERVRDGALVMDAHGQLADQTGQPIPVHTLIHAWSFLTYDHDRRRFAWLSGDGLGRYFLPGEAQMEEGLVALEAQRAMRTVRVMSPWFYDVVSGRFERQPLSGEMPDIVRRSNTNYGNFQYVPTRRQYFYGSGEGAYYYDPATSAWSAANDQGPRPVDYDHGGTHDSRRDRIYMGHGQGDATGPLYIFDVASATWTRPARQGDGPSSFRTNDASVMYDAVNDVVTVFHYTDRAIYTFEPTTELWSRTQLPERVLGPGSSASANAFYVPEVNVYVLHLAVDSEEDGIVWVYRHRNAR